MILPRITNPLGTCHAGQALWWALCTGYSVLRSFLGTGQPVPRVLPGYVCQKDFEVFLSKIIKVEVVLYTPLLCAIAGLCSVAILLQTVLTSLNASLMQMDHMAHLACTVCLVYIWVTFL